MSRISNANDILLSSIYYHFFSHITKLTTPSFSLNIENEKKNQSRWHWKTVKFCNNKSQEWTNNNQNQNKEGNTFW